MAALVTERAEILARWKQHFSDLLNMPFSITQDALDRIVALPEDSSLDVPPMIEGVAAAVSEMRNGKAPGSDDIPAEIHKHRGDALLYRLHALFKVVWQDEEVPQEFKDAAIVPIYKKKGDRTDCGNYRGISLLSIAGKILTRFLFPRLLKAVADDVLLEAQCGFRPNRGANDMIFAARQLQEKCREQHRDLYTVFIDLTKAFDMVSRSGLWLLFRTFGCRDVHEDPEIATRGHVG